LTEDLIDEIHGDVSTTALSDRWKAAVTWADVVLGTVAAPGEVTTTQLSRAERAELTLTVAVAQGFSKAAIAWGPAPSLPTTVIPTPGS
jgi:hypothetical protein